MSTFKDGQLISRIIGTGELGVGRTIDGVDISAHANATNNPHSVTADQASTSTIKLDSTGTGKIGVGTTSPVQALHLKGSNAFIKLEGSDAANVEWTVGVEGEDNFIIRDDTGDNKRLVIDSSGNVGIGTSTPGAKLSIPCVSGTVLEFGAAQNQIMKVVGVSGTDTAGKTLSIAAGAGTGTGVSGNLIFYVANAATSTGTSVNGLTTALTLTAQSAAAVSAGQTGPTATFAGNIELGDQQSILFGSATTSGQNNGDVGLSWSTDGTHALQFNFTGADEDDSGAGGIRIGSGANPKEQIGACFDAQIRRGHATTACSGFKATMDNSSGAHAAGAGAVMFGFQAAMTCDGSDNAGSNYIGFDVGIDGLDSNGSPPQFTGYNVTHASGKVLDTAFGIGDNAGNSYFRIAHTGDSGAGAGDGTINNVAGSLQIQSAEDIIFKSNSVECGRVHDVTGPPANSSATAGGLGFRRRVLTIDAGGGNASVTLTAADSGSMVVCAPGSNWIAITLPAITAGLEGVFFEFVLAEGDTVQTGKYVSIECAGADGNDDLMGQLTLIDRSSGAPVTISDIDGDKFIWPEDVEGGSSAKFTAVAGGANESWLVQATQSGAQATITD